MKSEGENTIRDVSLKENKISDIKKKTIINFKKKTIIMAKPVIDMRGTFLDIIKVLIEKRTIKPVQITKIYEKRNPGKPAKQSSKIMAELKKHIGYDDCFITLGARRGAYYEVPRGFETWKFEVALRTLPNNSDPEQKTKVLPPVDNFVDKFEEPVEETQNNNETEKIQKPVKVPEKDKKATIVFLHKAKNLICDSGTTALSDRALFLATKKPESNLDLDKHLFIIRTIGKKEGVNSAYDGIGDGQHKAQDGVQEA